MRWLKIYTTHNIIYNCDVSYYFSLSFLIYPKKVKSIASIDFKFLEKCLASYYTSELSSYMQRPYPREWILSSPYLVRKYDAKLISEGLELLSWDKCVITLSSKLLSGFDRKEKWFDTEYKFEPINPKLLQVFFSIFLFLFYFIHSVCLHLNYLSFFIRNYNI